MQFKMPDITPAQVISAVTWLVAQALAWGWINNDAGQRIISATSSLVAFAWILGDAIIRHGRNKTAAAQIAANAASTNVVHTHTP